MSDSQAGLTAPPTSGGSLPLHPRADMASESDIDTSVSVRAESKTGFAVGTVRTYGKKLFVATGDRWLEIIELQLAGKKRMSADAFLRGFREIETYKFV